MRYERYSELFSTLRAIFGLPFEKRTLRSHRICQTFEFAEFLRIHIGQIAGFGLIVRQKIQFLDQCIGTSQVQAHQFPAIFQDRLFSSLLVKLIIDAVMFGLFRLVVFQHGKIRDSIHPFGDFVADDTGHGRKKIPKGRDMVGLTRPGYHLGPTDQKRRTHTSLVEIALVAPEGTVAVEEIGIMPADTMHTIVGREDENGILPNTPTFQQLHDGPYAAVNLADHRRIGRLGFELGFEPPARLVDKRGLRKGVFVGAQIRIVKIGMGRRNGKIGKKGTVSMTIHELKPLFHDQEMAVNRTVEFDLSFVFIKMIRIITVCCALSQIAEEVVEPLIDWTSRGSGAAEAPFADTHRGIAFGFQQFGNGDLLIRQGEIERSGSTPHGTVSANGRMAGMLSGQQTTADGGWQYTDYKQRFAHYANLDPGRYTFRLKTTNESGQWNDYTRDMEIRILPPVWKTWWACMLYVIFGSSLIAIFYRLVRQRLRYRNQIRIQQAENERNVELNQAKLRFFTNITHELFTPITIISAATEELKSRIPEQEYGVIASNIDRLSRLIQQILEFRKAETGNLRLQVSNRDLPRFIAKNIESFGPLMKHKHIRISYECSEKSRKAFFDADKIDKILYNLLSNALKYNKEGAEVIVRLSFSDDGEHAVFSVEDNGQGLSERTMKNLFKRFYDGDFRKFNTSGTGIGLSLVNDLVKLHKGTIDVDNRPGSGVKFTVTIPITMSHYTEEECDEILASNPNPPTTVSSAQEKPLYRILVVEDNPDLNFVLRNMLARHYEVFSAGNGVEAMEIIRKENIDLIVSDVMMPEMDGYELCSRLKNDLDYSHIQIILLTARTEDEDVVEAYKAGADAYIPKPFSVKRLNARISNLLEAREKRIEKFKKQLSETTEGLNFQTLEYTSHDEKFLKDVIQTINENYTNPEFDKNMLLEKLGVSKSTLHRKLTSLTGCTASTMIKDARLKAAYDLLKRKDGPMVSEIAYAIGFNDPKYFSNCFKKEFGILPSEVEKEK